MENPSVNILTADYSKEQIEKEIEPEFKKACAEEYDGAKKVQLEWAVLAIGGVEK